MGQIYSYFCTSCGIDGDILQGCGACSCSSVYCCENCSTIFHILESHDFGSDEDDFDFKIDSSSSDLSDAGMSDAGMSETKEDNNDLSCEVCNSKKISPVTFKKRMKCPCCKSKEFYFSESGIWD
jgi:hypothetical protein